MELRAAICGNGDKVEIIARVDTCRGLNRIAELYMGIFIANKDCLRWMVCGLGGRIAVKG